MAEKQFITFYLDDDYLGVDIRLVREVYRQLNITPVALAPEFVRGLLNLRGQIITILDLGVRLGLGPRRIDRRSCCVILKSSLEMERKGTLYDIGDSTSPDQVGLLVDAIGDVVTVEETEVEPPPAHAGRLASAFLSGVVKLQNVLLIVLKASEIVGEKETASKATA